MSVYRAIGSLARRQHGLVTTEQLHQSGVRPGQVYREVDEGRLVPVRRRVYRLSGAPTTWAQAVLAAVLASGPGAVASHVTAGAIWDLKPMHPDARAIHVTAPRQVRLHGVRGHIGALSTKDRRTEGGIPVTSVERTIVNLAGTLTGRELGQCVDDALRRKLLRLERLRQLVQGEASQGRRHLRPLRQVLADRPAAFDAGDSDWEREMDRLWDTLGLPPARRQYPVTANGRRYVLDRAIPELKIGVEWNGFASHGGRSAFDYDSDRRADLTAEGWHMIDFTSRSDQNRLVAAVLGAVRTRDSATTSSVR